jgi:hypothetical protein
VSPIKKARTLPFLTGFFLPLRVRCGEKVISRRKGKAKEREPKMNKFVLVEERLSVSG